MKIGIFTDCYYPQVNGVVVSILILKNALEQSGHQVYIITGKDSGNTDTHNVISIPSISFFRWAEFRFALPFVAIRARKQIHSLDFDIIHTHTEFSIGKLGKKIAARRNIPLIHTYHTQYEDYTHYIAAVGTPLLKDVVRKWSNFFLRSYSAVIVPSEKTKQLLCTYGVKNKIFVIPTGIQFSRDSDKTIVKKKQALLERLGFSKEHFILLFLGRISLEKNIDMLIDVLPDLIQKDDKIRLLIVGAGPYFEAIKEKVKSKNIAQYIVFTGKVEHKDIDDYFALADLFISPSKTETQGLSIFEAIERKVPVLVYNDTNVKGIILNNVSGLLFESSEQLTDKILYAIQNPEKLQVFAQAAYKNIQHYSDEEFGKNVIAVYNEAINTFKHQSN
ncbi:glycosyltransferase [Treponema sp.]|uniref:glycosyltransferase n=1 Tax=Treponema sp. TaxID=166 RepID=UPI003FA253AA